ncbi:MAG: DUF192 domain-containing protein [Planctomycetota bacterium]
MSPTRGPAPRFNAAIDGPAVLEPVRPTNGVAPPTIGTCHAPTAARPEVCLAGDVALSYKTVWTQGGVAVLTSSTVGLWQVLGCCVLVALGGCSAITRGGLPGAAADSGLDRGDADPAPGDATAPADNCADMAATSEPDDDNTDDVDLLNQVPQNDLLDGTPNAEHLDSLALAHVRAGGQVFIVWVADTFLERQRGLMHVTDEEMGDLPDGRRRGMLFVFGRDTDVAFWMRDTIIPLDVAYIRADCTIDSIRTMAPLDEGRYPPDGPFRYALEVTAGTFAELGVIAGDRVDLPSSCLE